VGAAPVVDFLSDLRFCDIDHRGLVFDAGSPNLQGRFGFALDASDASVVEHDGATWLRVGSRSLELSFVLPQASPIFVQMRVAGAASSSATLQLDHQPLGTVSFGRDQIKTVVSPTTRLPADAGAHTLTIFFPGKGVPKKNAAEDAPRADIDWIRIGVPDDIEGTFGAPTMRDALSEKASLGGIPHKALALRPPARLRCPARVPKGGRFVVAAGMQGPGEVEGSVRVLRDGKPPLLLAKGTVKGGAGAMWTNLELAADGVPQGGRVLFGDPAIVGPAAQAKVDWKARAAVVVVLSGVERDELPGYGSAPLPGLEALDDLAKTATVFRAHRGPSTYSTVVMASLLTGRLPSGHRVADIASRLPSTGIAIGKLAKDAGARTAMFTGVPLSFRAFGFAEGWEKFEQYLPQSTALAVDPLRNAAKWVTEAIAGDAARRMLLVVHARGGHPPWDVTAKQLEQLAGPGEFAGALDPRRAAQVLARLRRKPEALSSQDHDRMRTLALIGLDGQDAALGELVLALKQAGIWDQTLFVVMGDVSSGTSRDALFGDGRELADRALATPLYVHFPGDRLAGVVVEEPTGILDVTRTLLVALGLEPAAKAPAGPGRDLLAVGLGGRVDALRVQVARQDDRYSVRWGSYVLTGRIGHTPTLCDLVLDPTCAFDRRPISPFATQALFRAFVDAEAAAAKGAWTREPLNLDQDTAAALSVWGETGG
jgi:hypothetical protein